MLYHNNMGRHSPYLRMKIKGKHQVVYRGTTMQAERIRKGKYLKKAQKWVCKVCKHVNNAASTNCHKKGCDYKIAEIR